MRRPGDRFGTAHRVCGRREHHSVFGVPRLGQDYRALPPSQAVEGCGRRGIVCRRVGVYKPASPVEIADLLIVLAGAFSDALIAERIDISSDNYWTRLRNSLTKTEVGVKELGLKAGAEGAGVDLKLEFRTSPLFRQRLSKHMSGRIGELRGEVLQFFEDGIKAVRKARGDDAKVVFLFDSLEQIRGSLSNEQEVTHSVEVLFSTHLKLLEIPYVHVVYTVPPWLKFVLPGLGMFVLPCLRLVEQRFRQIRMQLRGLRVELTGEEAL
jgi:hypothetical protein